MQLEIPTDEDLDEGKEAGHTPGGHTGTSIDGALEILLHVDHTYLV